MVSAGPIRRKPMPADAQELQNAGFEIVPMNERWQAILRGQHPASWLFRMCRRLLGLLPSPPRRKVCNAPFHGPVAGALRWIGMSPSRKNPSICARCVEYAPEGGAVVPVTILFADIRGYASATERSSSVEVTKLVERFYAAASRALLAHHGLLAQTTGDQVMALFVPGLAGGDYPRHAVAVAQDLFRQLGYDRKGGNWLDVGVGLCSGDDFVGNVGGGFKDFTAIGDATNTAARLTSVARVGEILACAYL
jgi:adenylate cyclase